MPDFVKYDLGQLAQGRVVEVSLDQRANVHLLNATNFTRYQRGDEFQYYGGEQVQSPAHIQVPHADHWYVTIDLGGGSGTIEASVRVL